MGPTLLTVEDCILPLIALCGWLGLLYWMWSAEAHPPRPLWIRFSPKLSRHVPSNPFLGS